MGATVCEYSNCDREDKRLVTPEEREHRSHPECWDGYQWETAVMVCGYSNCGRDDKHLVTPEEREHRSHPECWDGYQYEAYYEPDHRAGLGRAGLGWRRLGTRRL